MQNFHPVWLDESFGEVNNDDGRNFITKLRQVINTVNALTDMDECIDFIIDKREEKTFLIVSETFSQIIVPVVQDIYQVSSAYSEIGWRHHFPFSFLIHSFVIDI
jgi:hypothetical protein